MDKVPYNRGTTTSILGSLRLDGSNESLVIQGAVDGEVFRTYIREILLPTLRSGDRVIADNVSIHKDQEARELIESVGAYLEFLSPLFS
jgi:transposase